MNQFTDRDIEWINLAKDFPKAYQIIVDNDCIYIETTDSNGDQVLEYTFSLYGYDFAHALLEHIGCNVTMC